MERSNKTFAEPMMKRGKLSIKNRARLLKLTRKIVRKSQIITNKVIAKQTLFRNTKAMAELALAAGCNPGMKRTDMIKHVVEYLKRKNEANQEDKVFATFLKIRNQNLLLQLQSSKYHLLTPTTSKSVTTSTRSQYARDIGKK